jgi:hypothetical protein
MRLGDATQDLATMQSLMAATFDQENAIRALLTQAQANTASANDLQNRVASSNAPAQLAQLAATAAALAEQWQNAVASWMQAWGQIDIALQRQGWMPPVPVDLKSQADALGVTAKNLQVQAINASIAAAKYAQENWAQAAPQAVTQASQMVQTVKVTQAATTQQASPAAAITPSQATTVASNTNNLVATTQATAQNTPEGVYTLGTVQDAAGHAADAVGAAMQSGVGGLSPKAVGVGALILGLLLLRR